MEELSSNSAYRIWVDLEKNRVYCQGDTSPLGSEKFLRDLETACRKMNKGFTLLCDMPLSIHPETGTPEEIQAAQSFFRRFGRIVMTQGIFKVAEVNPAGSLHSDQAKSFPSREDAETWLNIDAVVVNITYNPDYFIWVHAGQNRIYADITTSGKVGAAEIARWIQDYQKALQYVVKGFTVLLDLSKASIFVEEDGLQALSGIIRSSEQKGMKKLAVVDPDKMHKWKTAHHFTLRSDARSWLDT